MSGKPDDLRGGASPDSNLAVYNSPGVAEHYSGLDYLSACEQALFSTHFKPGIDILDLGVGGGRTTGYLSSIARRYVGVDYAEKMIEVCREKFPELEFRTADATDLSMFADGSFDAVVFSFNGIDCIVPDAGREKCLRECRRVLRSAGLFVFSTHNPCAVLVRPLWDPRRVRSFAQRLVGPESRLLGATTAVVTCGKAVITTCRAMAESGNRILHRIPRRMFWTGEGWMKEPEHGGLTLHYASPQRVAAEAEEHGFRLVQMLGDDYPHASRRYITDWYYYVFAKQ